MGLGVALEFKKRWPEMFKRYRDACFDGDLIIGNPIIDKGQDPWIVNFPSKYRHQNRSRLEWIQSGCEALAEQLEGWGVTSMAMPLLGAGLGRLNNLQVYRVMKAALGGCPIPIEVRILEMIARELPAQDFRWPEIENNPLEEG
jgi:hypothetical protein